MIESTVTLVSKLRCNMVEVTRFELATPSSRTMCATKLRYTSKKIAPIYIEAVWLRNRDSNPNKQSQSLSCYRYTIPQCNSQLGYGYILYTFNQKSQHFFREIFKFFQFFSSEYFAFSLL